ncbi:SGNH/GDSL hydrolase family protein [Streptomyces pristinaespiralis]|nr:SGNH/GDSL hydrolase family protein [Streptomyces pristinaespiralis]ALC18832.1 GDSL family lipase [Streptomyces pristinaespiralis]
MKRMSPALGTAAAGMVAAVVTATASLTGAPPAQGDGDASRPDASEHRSSGQWLHTWVSMPQLTEPGNMPPAPFTRPGRVLADSTVRQTVHVSTGGQRLRLRFSNAFGGTALPITAASVALPVDGRAGVSGIRPESSRPLTFGGRASVTVPVGAQVVSDPLGFDLEPGSNLTVTVYLAEGQASEDITSHPGSRTTTYLKAGNHAQDAELPGATGTDHWYFLSGVEVWSTRAAGAAVMLGDSLTDGRGSTTNLNNRWPDLLLRRLQSRRGTADTAILNQAAGGNRVLNDGLGPNALARLDRDVLASSGVEWLVVFEGVNDIGTAAAGPAAQKEVVDELTAAYRQIVTRAHAQGIRVYGATLTPFGGNAGYDDPEGLREASRQAVNHWIRTSGRFDGVIDFDKVARDPDSPRQLLPAFDVGDHLHLNPTGYQALADAVPVSLFRHRPLPRD